MVYVYLRGNHPRRDISEDKCLKLLYDRQQIANSYMRSSFSLFIKYIRNHPFLYVYVLRITITIQHLITQYKNQKTALSISNDPRVVLFNHLIILLLFFL